MKKILFTVLTAVLVCVLTLGVVVACDDTAKTYTVTFKNGDTVVDTTEVEQGKPLTADQIPGAPQAPQGKVFSGWYVGEDKIEAGYTPTGDVTATAKFKDEEPQPSGKYTVTFKNGDTVVDTAEVEQGKSLTADQIPGAPQAPQGKVFYGWYVGEDKIEAGYTPTGDVTATAKFNDDGDITGSGTKEDPYVIHTAKGLVTFADNVNHPDVEATENWYTAYYKLGADLDMTGIDYTPAGSRVVTEGEGGETERVLYGFQGSFDGDGHTISNLYVKYTLLGTEYAGLFGSTYSASITNLKLDVTVELESYAPTDDIIVYVGAVAGSASLTTLNNVQAKLVVNTKLLNNNLLTVGGIVGMYHTATKSDRVEIYDCSNLYAEIDLHAVPFDKGNAESVLNNTFAGGIFGLAYMGTGGGLALYNVSATGTIGGGKYLGGIIGSLSGDYVSIINAVSDVDITVTAPGDSTSGYPYAGGIVGEALGCDFVIMDCYAGGKVTGNTVSTVGGIVGAADVDDYEEYITRGAAIVNCYYSGAVSGSLQTNSFGSKTTEAFSQSFATDKLGFDTKTWSFADGKAIPDGENAGKINNGQYTLTLVVGDQTRTVTRGGNDGYDILRSVDAPTVADGSVFWDWQLADGVDYRMYIPVIKNMTLTAKVVDVTEVLHVYEGFSDYQGAQVGVIKLNGDGTFDYILSGTGTADKGTWRYDGEHFVAQVGESSIVGTLTANVGGKHVIKWSWSEGNGYYVTYTFTETDTSLQLIGEYYSDDGDIITFSGTNTVSLLIDDIMALHGHNAVSATFNRLGNLITLIGLESYYSVATITVTPTGFTTNFVALDNAGISDNKKQYSKDIDTNYANFALLGDNNSLYMYNDYQDAHTMTFKPDGTMVYGSTYSSVKGRYYVFGTKVKVIVDDYVSTFKFDGERGILYGYFEAGYTARSQTVVTPAVDGELNGFIIGGNRQTVVFVTDKDLYYMIDGVLQTEAVITGTFADGENVTVNGIKYLVSVGLHDSRTACILYTVGKEEGDYTFDGKTIRLNGVNKVTGGFEGSYVVNGNYVSLYDIQNGRFVVFDYTAAQAAGNVITPATGDGYQGIWFRTVTLTDDDTEEDYDVPKYYVLMLDGFGHVQLLYLWDSETGEYHANWGDEWNTYTILANGDVTVRFNEYQIPVFSFYYNKQLVIANDKTSGVVKGYVFLADGYDGDQTIPKFDGKLAGKYSGEGVELEIKSDLGGTLNGTAFTARVDGNNVLVFTVGNVEYTFDGNKLTLTHGETVVQLTAGEEKPLDIVGTWKGTLTGTLYYDGYSVTVVITADGKITVTIGEFDPLTGTYAWDPTTKTLTASGIANSYLSDGWSEVLDIRFTVTDKIEIGIDLEYDYMTEYTLSGELAKESVEDLPFPQGTWTGTVTQEGGYPSQSITGTTISVEFGSDGTVTITLTADNVYSGTYTYENGIINASVSGAMSVTNIEFAVDGTSISFTLELEDEDFGIVMSYTATLAK